MVKCVLTIKLKMANILLKTNLPEFHYSIIPYSRQRSSLKKCPIFSLSCRISETLGYKTIQDQSVKTPLVRRCKKPSQMRKALDANSNSPAKTRKPAKFRRGRTRMAASLNGSKTPYFKNNSVGVGKGMLVRPLDFYALGRTRYHVMTLATKDVLLLIRCFLYGFILNKAVKHFIALFFRRHPKKMWKICIYCYHSLPYFLIRQIRTTGITFFDSS